MRMCGHAHHDDMLYLGKEPPASWEYPPLTPQGYADPGRYAFWRTRDPIPAYAAGTHARRTDQGRRSRSHEAARPRPWWRPRRRRSSTPAGRMPAPVTSCVYRRSIRLDRRRVEVLDREWRGALSRRRRSRLSPRRRSIRKGMTFLDAVMQGVGDALAADPRGVRVRRGRRRQVRQRVPAAAAAAREIRRPHPEFDRSPKAPCSARASGAALAGLRPIGEMQFNDFVATGFNQLVNNAAKIRYRWGGSRCRWSSACRGAACGTPGRTTRRTPSRGSIARPGSRSSSRRRRSTRARSWRRRSPIRIRCCTTNTSRSIAIRASGSVVDAAPAAAPGRPRPPCAGQGDDLAIISYGAYVHAGAARRGPAPRVRHRGERPRSALARAARSRRRR